MNKYHYYPKEVFSINMDVTRRNMELYDKRQKKIEDELLRRYPDYYRMKTKDRVEARKEVEKEIF